MSPISKNTRQNLLILFGILFVVGGLVGAMIDLRQEPAAKSYGMFIGPMKSRKATPTATPFQDLQPTPTTTPEATPQVVQGLIDEYGPKSNFVHDISDPLIEHPSIPDRIVIPSINLDAPVVSADYNFTKVEGETFGQWQAANMFAAGWHPNSALLGKRGNTVINGHHNEYGEVFGNLVDVEVGDLIEVYSRGAKFSFVVANRMILPERFQPAAVRLENARWISATDDVRLTLVTCWPKTSNTHRLILVARPIANN